MALVVKDRVRETSTSTGTGTITLNGAVTGFQSFTVIGNTNTTYYTIVDGATGAWEVGIGTYTSSGTLLSRDTILESSNAGSAVDFAAGIKDVFVTYPAERSVDSDTAQTLTNKTLSSGTAITAGTINGAVIGGSTAAAGTFTTLTTSSTVTLNGGTANGVAYLNASKVVTSGSALTFDGTTLSNKNNITALSGTNSADIYFAIGNAISGSNSGFFGWRYNSGSPYTYLESYAQGIPTRFGGSEIQFQIANGERMRLTSTGLGIGTSSPSYTFQVTNNSNANATSAITNSTAGTSSVARFLAISDAGNASFGMASTSYTDIAGAADSAFISAANASGGIVFANDAVVQMRLDSSGNLGLGVTPSAWGSYRGLQVGNASVADTIGGNNALFGSNVFFDGSNFKYISTATSTLYRQVGGEHRWENAPSGTAGNTISFTQAMTLTAAGELLVGTTSVNGVGKSFYASGFAYSNRSGTAAASHFDFANDNGAIGQILTSGSATTYATSSDYRLKENVQPMTGALAKVAQLKPVTYTWKADGSEGQGFIAHELQAVVPDAVTGEKDAVDKDGKPKYQGVDTSFLVATLTAAIQEQQAIITDLTTRLTALEGN